MEIRRWGRVLIVLGVAVWAVFAIAWLLGLEPVVRSFLPLHLVGVIPGAIMSRWRVAGESP